MTCAAKVLLTWGMSLYMTLTISFFSGHCCSGLFPASTPEPSPEAAGHSCTSPRCAGTKTVTEVRDCEAAVTVVRKKGIVTHLQAWPFVKHDGRECLDGPTATFQPQASPGNPLAVSKSMMALAPAAPNVPVIPPGGAAFLPAPRPKGQSQGSHAEGFGQGLRQACQAVRAVQSLAEFQGVQDLRAGCDCDSTFTTSFCS